MPSLVAAEIDVRQGQFSLASRNMLSHKVHCGGVYDGYGMQVGIKILRAEVANL
jgi:hypothetical protein